MFATEAYEPNVALARERLGPLGVTVLPYRSDDLVGGPLPFDDASLDVVLDRHESYGACEVARVLAPRGRFLTQQVDGRASPICWASSARRPRHPRCSWTASSAMPRVPVSASSARTHGGATRRSPMSGRSSTSSRRSHGPCRGSRSRRTRRCSVSSTSADSNAPGPSSFAPAGF